MGSQQIILIIIGFIIVSIAVMIGMNMFRSQEELGRIDFIVRDLQSLGALAMQYRTFPVGMGGGGNSFLHFDDYFYNLPLQQKSNINGLYRCSTSDVNAKSVRIKGTTASDVNLVRWILVNDKGFMTIHMTEPELLQD